MPADFTDADAKSSSSAMYDSTGVLINLPAGKTGATEGPWKIDAGLKRVGGAWSIASTISYDQAVGCFGKATTRSVYVVVYYGTSGNLRIGTVSVALSDRLKRLAKELRPQVEALVKEKEAFDAELPKARSRFDEAGPTAPPPPRRARPVPPP